MRLVLLLVETKFNYLRHCLVFLGVLIVVVLVVVVGLKIEIFSICIDNILGHRLLRVTIGPLNLIFAACH